MENNVRGPTKEIIRAYYESNEITLKELAELFKIKYSTVKSWKNRDKNNGIDWVQPNKKKIATKDATTETKKVAKLQNKKQLLNKAKSMVISGSTLEDASEKTGIPIGTLGNHSTSEKWLESRKAYNNFIYTEMISELGRQHLNDRKNAVKMSRVISVKAFKDMQQGKLDANKAKMYKEVAEIVDKTIMTASKMLGIKDINKLDLNELEEEEVEDDTFKIEVFKTWRD